MKANPTPPPCEEFEVLIDARSEGLIDEADERRLSMHAAGCPGCREAVRAAAGWRMFADALDRRGVEAVAMDVRLDPAAIAAAARARDAAPLRRAVPLIAEATSFALFTLTCALIFILFYLDQPPHAGLMVGLFLAFRDAAREVAGARLLNLDAGFVALVALVALAVNVALFLPAIAHRPRRHSH